jgi:hypothetical protein
VVIPGFRTNPPPLAWSESAKQEPQELRDRHSKRESDQSIPDPALLTWVDRERRFGVARLTSAIT